MTSSNFPVKVNSYFLSSVNPLITPCAPEYLFFISVHITRTTYYGHFVSLDLCKMVCLYLQNDSLLLVGTHCLHNSNFSSDETKSNFGLGWHGLKLLRVRSIALIALSYVALRCILLCFCCTYSL